MSDSFLPHGLYLARLLCQWDFSGKNTEVGCHFLLQGIFPTQGSDPCFLSLLHYRQILLPPSHQGGLIVISEGAAFPVAVLRTPFLAPVNLDADPKDAKHC